MNIFKRTVALMVTAVMIFSLSACGKTKPADSFTVDKKEASLNVSAETDKKTLYLSKAKNSLTLVAKSDMIELYFDKENCSVSVYETASGKLWSSLPAKDEGVKTSVVSVTVLIDGNKYTLSSQSDSVGFSSALYEEKENGVTVNYGFKRTLEDGTKINIFLPVSYILSDGALTVEADCSAVTGEENGRNVIVTDIDILPFFGAQEKGNKGDYMLLPDGSGLTVSLAENPDEFKSISLPAYEEGNILGAFGMKNGESAFAAFIDEGSEIASVKADKALSKGGYNSVYSSFEITDTLDDGDKVYVSSSSYKGKIRLVYRFLSYDNASYVGMAGAVRELLIRNGKLLSKSVDESTEYPFNLSLIFQNYVADAKGKTLSQNLTTYPQAQEILTALKAKGIENINLRLKGVLTKDNITKADYSSEPGNAKSLRELLAYGKTSGVTFYTDADILTALPEKSFSALAVNLKGEAAQSSNKVITSSEKISDNTNALLLLMREKGTDGICIADAGSLLYGDFTKGISSLKNETANVIAKEVSSVSASKKLMVDTGNIYSVKYADVIVNLPLTAKLQDRDLCSSVPFVQSILHGLISYSAEPVNSSNNSERAFLKAVEYGAIPYYEWYASDLSSEEAKDKLSYVNYITEAQGQYERASEAFSDLRGARITDHYRVKKNVYYTQYDNSTGVYVNYNNEAVTVSGVTVDGMSFLRVN